MRGLLTHATIEIDVIHTLHNVRTTIHCTLVLLRVPRLILQAGGLDMSVLQMVAWFNLSIAIVTAAAYLVLWTIIGPWRAMGAFGLLGFAGLSVLFYRKSKITGRVSADERDALIGIKAFAAA